MKKNRLISCVLLLCCAGLYACGSQTENQLSAGQSSQNAKLPDQIELSSSAENIAASIAFFENGSTQIEPSQLLVQNQNNPFTTSTDDSSAMLEPISPQPESPQPESPQPENPQPESPQPESPQPESPQPESPQPESPQPENPQPESPQPENPQPENPQPENPQPENPQPENPQPENPQPAPEPGIGSAIGDDALAFPGAVGWAAESTIGGRGGKVVIVNSLANVIDPTDNIMTFREALTEINEPRVIVFAVAGLIDYRSGESVPKSQIKLNNSDSFVTIACQSAPPPGVTLVGDGLVFVGNTNNVIMRHCRFRNSDPATVGAAENSSCIRVNGTSPAQNGEVQHNYVLDHVSCMWAADDPISFSIPGISENIGENIRNVTISDTIVSEGDADSLHEESNQIPKRYLHAMGAGCATANAFRTVERCSMVGNFMAHNSRRNGRLWGVSEGELINNIIYNPHEVGLSAKARPLDVNNIDGIIRGNLIQLGPTSKATVIPMDLGGNTLANSRLRIEGNYLGQYRGTAVEAYDNVPGANGNIPNTLQVSPAQNILSLSLKGSDHLRCIGASRPHRDSHDQRIISEFHQQSGQVGIMGNHERDYSEYSSVALAQSWLDNDVDGMPDTWESKMGLSGANSYDLSDNYTNLEVFLNNLAACPSVSFDTTTISYPAGTSTVSIPYNSNWETWSDGQTFEVCLNDNCHRYYDTENVQEYVAKGLNDGRHRLTMTPIGVGGQAEPISASIEITIGL